jgi:hypothetical protein
MAVAMVAHIRRPEPVNEKWQHRLAEYHTKPVARHRDREAVRPVLAAAREEAERNFQTDLVAAHSASVPHPLKIIWDALPQDEAITERAIAQRSGFPLAVVMSWLTKGLTLARVGGGSWHRARRAIL